MLLLQEMELAAVLLNIPVVQKILGVRISSKQKVLYV